MAGIGYTAALVVMGLGVLNMGWNMDFSLPTVAIIGGGSIPYIIKGESSPIGIAIGPVVVACGSIAAFAYLKEAGVDY